MHKHNLLKVLSVLAILAMLFSNFQLPVAQAQQAQSGDGLKRQVNAESHRVSFIGPENGRVLPAAKALGTTVRPQDPAMALAKKYAHEFGLANPERDLSVMKKKHENNGRSIVRYQQKYNGIPVMGGELIVNTDDDGNLYSMNGEVSSDLTLDTKPAINAKQARETALQSMAKWYEKQPEDFTVTEPELWVFDESLLQPSTRPAELVWRMEVKPKELGMPVRELVLVNAQRGGISFHFNQVDSAWSGSQQDDVPPTPTPEPPQLTETPLPTDPSAAISTSSPTIENTQPTLQAAAEEATTLGATWYVATTGDDAHDCATTSTPCATINAAIGKASAGGTVYVAVGTYTGSGTEVVSISKSITISGGWNNGFSAQTGMSTIDGQATRRGVMLNSGLTATIDHVVVQNGNALPYAGSGIFNNSNTTLMLNNSAVTDSQGVGVNNYGNLTLNSSTISGSTNTGIHNAGGTLTMNNSTLSGNTGTGSGGGAILNEGTATLNNSTVSGNTTTFGPGGGIYNMSGLVTLKNTIIAGNSAKTSGPDCAGNISSNGYNLIGNSSGCTFTSSTGDLTNIDAKLGVLIGSPSYYFLQASSPAINAGNPTTPGSGGNACLAVDERGVARPVGGRCDIGAYEYTAPGTATSLSIVSGNNQRVVPGQTFPMPLQVAALDIQGSPVPAVSVTFTAPVSGPTGVFAGTNSQTTVITDVNGLATSPTFTANSVYGSYTVIASSNGLGSVNFNLQNGGWFVATTGNDADDCNTPLTSCATINAAIGKAEADATVRVALGTYTGSGTEVVSMSKNVTLSGGWNDTFDSQNGLSVIDGQNMRSGVYGPGTIDHFMITNGFSSSWGAGITFFSGNFVLNNSVVINNKAGSSTGSAGGIAAGGNLTLNNSTVRENFSSYNGGGILITGGGSLTLNNSTIAGNQAISQGGGILLQGGSATILNSTIANNRAPYTGGIAIQSNSVTVKNSIIANNTSANYGPDCTGTINLLDHSLLGAGSNCTVASGTGNLINVNPMLSAYPIGMLGYYALRSGSPAIHTGANCLSKDQRGISRPQGNGCDMGAYEYTTPGQPSSLGILSGSDQRTGTFLSFPKQLAVYVVDSAGSPVSGVNVTFTAPSSGASGTFANNGTTSTVLTGESGVAVAPSFTANSEHGTYFVNASASGLSGSVNFSLANADWYVSTAGNDANDCVTITTPCATINGAISKALDGGAIKVAQGTYTGSSNPVVNITKGLVLSGGWNNSFTSQTSYSSVDGGNTYDGISVPSLSDVKISNFVVKNNVVGISTNGGNFYFERGGLIGNRNGISNYGNTTFLNTTISGNRADCCLAGSAIGNVSGTVKILYSTIDNNTGSTDTIWSVNGNAVIEIGNSILAGIDNSNCNANMLSDGHNVFGSATPCVGSVTLQSSDKVGVDPKLLPIQPNGFYPILSSSPAIDQADSATCPATDQRGVARPWGSKCDIGAFEYSGSGTTPATILAYAGTPQSIGRGSLSPVNLQALVQDEKGNGITGVVVTFTAPASGASATFTDTHTYTTIAITGADGIGISSAFQANTLIGAYTITATVSGIASPANFSITNTSSPVRTYTANNYMNLPGSLICTESDPTCAAADYYSNTYAKAAHKYAIGVANFYMDKHDRFGIDGNNMPIISTVDYCPQYQGSFICPYDNAFWNGEQMVYGDAHNWPMADDVVAHELTHGVTQYESNLFYYYQSGAISESLSDLWGEYYDQTNGQGNDSSNVRWLIGEDLTTDGSFILRSMSNPPAYGDPDKMSSPLYQELPYYDDWWDSGGAHTNSGINNKAVYLMVDGGTFNYHTVTGLGWDKVAAIYYEANTNLLTSGADYSDLYYALQAACMNLIGEKGIGWPDCSQVGNALDAVEMNQSLTNFNADGPFCDAGKAANSFFADDLENSLGNWTIDNGGTLRWQYDSPYAQYAQSGNHFLYADDYPQNGTPTDAKARLVSFYVPSNAYLRFTHAYEFEYEPGANYDGGVLEYSINNGSTWVDAGSLMQYNGYNGTIYASYNNPLKGKNGFVQSSHGYISTRLNLASLAGKTVTFRWRMGLDAYVSVWGWWVDNIQAYTCGTVATISGNVGMPGVTLSYVDGVAKTVTSGQDGSYSFPVTAGWTGTVTPSLSCYSFDPPKRSYVNLAGNKFSENYTASVVTHSSGNVDVQIGGVEQGNYALARGESTRQNYAGLDSGPVRVVSTNCMPIVASLRDLWWNGSAYTSSIQLMGLPESQLSDTYVFPSYNNVSLNDQLRFGNVGDANTTVLVYIGGQFVGSYDLAPGQRQKASYPGLDSGPVIVKSSNGVPIIASIRDAWINNGVTSSFSQLMGLPQGQLSDTYIFPSYNNVTLNDQLRFGNVGNAPTTVTVTIGGQLMGSYYLLPNQRDKASYAGLDSGPVIVHSSNGVPIIASLREAWLNNGVTSSYFQLMGLPQSQLSDKYVFPVYDNVSLSGQLRFGNVGNANTTVTVTIGGVVKGTYDLAPNQRQKVSYTGLDGGPVVVQSSNGVPIIAALRDAWLVNGVTNSFSQLMGLPGEQLSTVYVFPSYNNVTYDNQLRIGVP